MEGLLAVGRIAVLAYSALLLLTWLGQDGMLYYPEVGGRQLTVTPADAGLLYSEVELTTADGEQLHGWFVPAADGAPVVLFFHGNAGNISHRLDSLRIFHALGYAVFIFDYRGYGQSSGAPSEAGLYRDADTAWKYLTDTRGYRSDQIVMFGRSLGGAVATYLANRHSPRALILESTFTSVPDLGADLYPWLPVRWLSRHDYNSLARLTAVRCPLLVIHSIDDEIIPFRHGLALFEAASEPKQLLQLQGGHNDGFLRSGAAYRQGLKEFLAAAFLSRPAPSAPPAGVPPSPAPAP